MSTHPKRSLPDSSVVTLVAADAVNKLGALSVISLALDSPVRGSGTSRPSISLGEGIWIEIDIPKFGEPPPLSIDVHAVEGVEAARSAALELLGILRESTAWTITPAFPL